MNTPDFLAGVGLLNGVIDTRLFVAIVVMALVTSLLAGRMMSRLLHQGSDPEIAAPATGALCSVLSLFTTGVLRWQKRVDWSWTSSMSTACR